MEAAVDPVFCTGVGDFSVDLLSVPLSDPGIYVHHGLTGDTGKTLCDAAVRHLGVMFLFAGVMSLLIGRIFFPEKEN